MNSFTDATPGEIDTVMKNAAAAYPLYSKTSAEQKAAFLETIASEIDSLGDSLITRASEETNLPAARLLGERARTTMQLRMFAEMLREGSFVEASIDTAKPDRKPLPRADIRKMLIPIGPIVVFGASNFPFAYSTAGGDTASALAAGCPVVVKAHPAHPKTSVSVYNAILTAIDKCNMPANVFQHVHGASVESGKALVEHPLTAGVGFTGSLSGGRALFDYASQRSRPIPVFAEMSSVNPVVFFSDTLAKNAPALAKMYSDSISLGMGQFCTNPGIMIAVESEGLTNFIQHLDNEFSQVQPAKMLHQGIHKSYFEKMGVVIHEPGVTVLQQSVKQPAELEAYPTIAAVPGQEFLQNPTLHEEVFGPYSLLIKCRDQEELLQVWKSLKGQLTTSIMATDADLSAHPEIISIATQVAGRIVFNSVPTGVEVCPSMVHGGPYPACTDSRFSAVGITAVKSWLRPVCFQNCPQELLPDELKDGNPRGIWRMEDNAMVR